MSSADTKVGQQFLSVISSVSLSSLLLPSLELSPLCFREGFSISIGSLALRLLLYGVNNRIGPALKKKNVLVFFFYFS